MYFSIYLTGVNNFYPRPPRGGRHSAPILYVRIAGFLSTPSARRATASDCGHADQVLISIHALREEGDPSTSATSASSRNFYPRPPRGGRPLEGCVKIVPLLISIHALREEGDLSILKNALLMTYFYPRPPRGGRRRPRGREAAPNQISIHALREEGDRRVLRLRNHAGGFLSTPSARRATAGSAGGRP